MAQITATTNGGRVVCKGCGEEIHFIKSAKNSKQVPCNLGAVTIITKDGQVVQGFVSHFATCPKADFFRKDDKKDGK